MQGQRTDSATQQLTGLSFNVRQRRRSGSSPFSVLRRPRRSQGIENTLKNTNYITYNLVLQFCFITKFLSIKLLITVLYSL